ncbi:MAG: amidohydrolase, partial [Roseiarcus sp.]
MSDLLAGVILLPTDGAPAGPPVDIALQDGRIASISPAASQPSRRLLAMPALVNAHDHARPLSPTSFGAAAKPLETWL